MLKRNLIAIAIAGLAMIFTSSMFGQEPNLQGAEGNRSRPPRAVRVATGDVTGDGVNLTGRRRRGVRNPTTTRGLTVNGMGGNDTLHRGLTKTGAGTLAVGLRNRKSIQSPRDPASGLSTGRRIIGRRRN